MHLSLRRSRFTLAAATSLLATCLFLAAGAVTPPPPNASPDAPAKAKPPAPPPIVAVKKSDGSSLRGQLLAADGLVLTVKPSEAGGKYGEPVDVKWGEIKSVSNGLTQQKAKQAWKAEHKGDLCDACHGERMVPCHDCKGTGHDHAASKDCKTCKGEGSVPCKQAKCEKGMLPCPAPCFKTPGEHKIGKWIFDVPAGHVGDIVKYENGRPVPAGKCPTCGGTLKVVCPTCGGQAVVPCPTCKADKSAADCPSCEDGTEPCAKCNGSGTKTPAPKKAQAPPAPTATTPEPKTAAPKDKPDKGDGLD